MPVSLVQRGPFSYDELTVAANQAGASPSAPRDFTLTNAIFDSTIGEVLEVFVNGVKLVGSGLNATGDEFTVDGNVSKITIVADSALNTASDSAVTTLAHNDTVLIRRVSDRTAKKVDFAPGSVIREADLDNANTQVFHTAQEAIDIALQAMVVDTDSKWNGESGGANRKIKNVATPAANDSDDHVATKGYADSTLNTTATYRDDALDHRDTAQDYATRTGAVVRHFDGATNNTSDSSPSDQAGVYSAKEFAIGTTGSTGGSAKDWAVYTSGDVRGGTAGDMSSKEWAVGTQGRGVANEGSSKDWATYTSGTVDNVDYSAKYWALVAEQSKLAAAASSASIAQIFDKFDDKYLGQMADGASATDADTTGTWATNSSVITVASKSNIIVGQEVTGTGIPEDANVIAVSSTSNEVTISENMDAAGANVDLDFRGQGVYGAFNTSKDGPTTDNDGNTLVTGALYFNTTDGEMRVYDGNNWLAASAAQNATILEYVYDITGSVTSIVGASGTGFAENDSNAVSFGSNESVHVYLNGVQLVEGASDDYQLTPASNTVTFNSAVVSGDIVKIVVYKTFTVADTVSASTGGTFSGNVAVNADFTVVNPSTNSASMMVSQKLESTNAYNANPRAGILGKVKYNSGGDSTEIAGIDFGKENGTDGDYAGDIKFHTRKNGSSIANTMTLGSSGNVEIDSDSAGNKFSIKSNSNRIIANIRNDSDTNSNGYLDLYQNGVQKVQITSAANQPTFFNSGNVGIGVSPAQLLHIEGADTKGLRIGVTGQSYYHEVLSNGDGLKLSADTSNAGGAGADIRFDVAGSEKMRIQKNGHLGIGTTSPTTFNNFTTVHHKNAAGDAINLTETDGGVISQEIATDASSGSVLVGARSNHPLKLTVNDSSKLEIDTSGSITTPNSGSFNGTIGSSATFPPGSLYQVTQNQFTTFYSVYTTSGGTFYQFQDASSNPLRTTISNCRSGSKILISCYLHYSINETNRAAWFRLVDATNSNAVIGNEGTAGLFGNFDNGNALYGGVNVTYEILYTPPSFSSGSFSVDLYGAVDDAGETLSINDSASGGTAREYSSNIILKEIAG